MNTPRFTHSLHFRMSALFLVMLGLSVGGYYLWINATVFKAYNSDEEETWYEETQEKELADLADSIGPLLDQGPTLAEQLGDYGRRIARYGAEVVLFDAHGYNMVSSAGDSMALAVKHVDPELLSAMSTDDWDFSTYPLDTDISAYENRIIDVVSIPAATGGDEPAAYLAASFRPMTFAPAEINSDWYNFGLRAVAVVLIDVILTALIIMAWASRRIGKLTHGVEAFAGGDFDRRVPDRSADEIGTLGRHFNTMAGRLQTMMEELGAKEQFQRQLIANVSHDLRTPLASLRGYIETLGLDPDHLDREDRSRYLNIIGNNLDYLDQLIERMLILSRLESGQAHQRRETFGPGELADSVLTRCESVAARSDVTLELEVEAGAEEAKVTADALQIGQALQNLVDNGIKFNRLGGKVTIHISADPQRVEIRVTDTGAGIPAEDLPHIFDRFYVGEKSRTRAALGRGEKEAGSVHLSSGLGLAITHKIISGHGSTLEVESHVGRGTVFRFQLPRSDETADTRSFRA